MKNQLWFDLIDTAKESFALKKDIDNAWVPTSQQIFSAQLHQLRRVEGNRSSQNYTNAMNFIKNANSELQLLDSTLETQAYNQIYARIIELLNMGLWSSEANPTKRALSMGENGKQKFNRVQRDREAAAACEELSKLLDLIKVNEPIKIQILTTFQNRILKQTGNTKKYVADKADLAEVLAVEVLSKNPGWKVLQTGQFIDELGEQLIQDVMTFDNSKLSQTFQKGALSFTIISNRGSTKTQYTATSLGDFFKQIEALNGEYTIKLEDKLRDELQKASILSTQVKSGMHGQPILTKAKRNQISLSKSGIYFFGGKETAYVKLFQLYQNKDVEFKREENSTELAALANYRLSKNIAKTAISKNELYFTEDGFVTASEWLDKHKSMIKFVSPKMSMDRTSFLSAEQRYQIYKA